MTDKLSAEFETAIRQAFYDGFMTSGEGFNGEYKPTYADEEINKLAEEYVQSLNSIVEDKEITPDAWRSNYGGPSYHYTSFDASKARWEPLYKHPLAPIGSNDGLEAKITRIIYETIPAVTGTSEEAQQAFDDAQQAALKIISIIVERKKNA